MIVYQWGGGFHMVPEGFTIENCSLDIAWNLWHLGKPTGTQPVGPHKNLTKLDFPTNPRRRFFEFATLMKKMSAAVTLPQQPTAMQVAAQFDTAFKSLELPVTTIKGMKRRLTQHTWQTVHTNLSKKQKP